MTERRDLLIIGGGLVGMTLAIAAARKGFSSHVVDRADPQDLTAEGFDGRASAISTASWNLFTNIGIADGLEPNRKLGVLSAFLKMQGIDSKMAKAYHADLKQTETA